MPMEQPATTGTAGLLSSQLSDPTVGELKLKIAKLEKELAEAKTRDPSAGDEQRILLLENLLEDSKKMKNKFEEDSLKIHQRNVYLEAEVEKLKSTGRPVDT